MGHQVAAYNKLPKFAQTTSETNTHWVSPNNVCICRVAKR
jgi:hypothetical protein